MWRKINKNNISFFELISPALPSLNELYWCIDVQCGLIESEWLLSNIRNEELFFSYCIPNKWFGFGEYSSIRGFRPGCLSAFGEYIRSDEGAVYFGFQVFDNLALLKALKEIDRKVFDEILFEDLLNLDNSIHIIINNNDAWEVCSKNVIYHQFF